jgi:hypothetical protein
MFVRQIEDTEVRSIEIDRFVPADESRLGRRLAAFPERIL